MAEVKFCVHVETHEDFYGVTLYADPGEEVSEVPCFRSCFRGEKGRDVDEVVELFAQCHQEAMDDVGLAGAVPESEYEAMLLQSVTLAGEMMSKFGLQAVAFDQVPDEALYCLFAEALPDGENSPGSAALN